MTDTEQPLSADQYLVEAWHWYERRRPDRARGAIAHGLRLNPEHIELRRLLATLAYEDDLDDEARTQVQAILRDAPEDRAARLLLAKIETSLGQHARAEELLLDLLRDYPDDANLISQYAHLMLKTLHLDKAKALAAEALRRDPDGEYPLVIATLCDIVSGKRLPDQRALSELLDRHPHIRATALMLISALLQAGKSAEAQRISAELIRVDPRDRIALSVAKEIAYVRHWSMRPLLPFQRWGWAGVIGMWALVAVLIRVIPPIYVTPLALSYLLYCIYSWVWPGILRRWMFAK